jgi:D-alanyl-lipoteichoic acid acyltransferase DltB (MBOAT superfamily)
MLFNSYAFIFVFLPTTLAVFYYLRLHAPLAAVWWLTAASLFFYAYWNPIYVPLLLGSILFNYIISVFIERSRNRVLLGVGIAGNLFALGYFKYAGFFTGMVVAREAIPDFINSIVLPLGISFFTFHQIAYLIDVWRGEVRVARFDTYALFVSFFPQLIAGPIVRYGEVAHQFDAFANARRLVPRIAVVGAILFVIGLSKKVLVADSLAPYVNDVFKFAEQGPAYPVGYLDAWVGALGYTFQLYFDFSGYTDMALGLALMLGVRLPINFFSPYKSLSIIEFWRRWHISLSRFFRDYVYFSLGGSRHGRSLQMLNLMGTMALVGLWHGAGWTFVVWGIYHGTLLVLTHMVKQVWSHLQHYVPAVERFHNGILTNEMARRGAIVLAWSLTFLLIVVGWVIFRATSMTSALGVLDGMALVNGAKGYGYALVDGRLYPTAAVIIAASAFLALAFPNTVEMTRRLSSVLDKNSTQRLQRASAISLNWRLSPAYAVLLGLLAYLALTTVGNVSTEFLYFNF